MRDTSTRSARVVRPLGALRAALAQKQHPQELWDLQEFRYLVIGLFNTFLGYSLGLLLYACLSAWLHVLAIGMLASAIAISIAFCLQKVLVFRTSGNWMTEYLKCWLVYGGGAVCGAILLWLLVDGLRVPFWIANGIAILLVAMGSYLGHLHFTFHHGERPPP